jgi:hypothetical protein
MKDGLSAESPSAARTCAMAKFSPLSKSTKVSAPHTASRSVSRVTTSPALPTRMASTCAGCD